MGRRLRRRSSGLRRRRGAHRALPRRRRLAVEARDPLLHPQRRVAPHEPDHLRRGPCHRSARGDRFQHQRAGSDLRPSPHSDVAEDRRSRADQDVVLDFRVAVPGVFPRAPQGDVLEDRDVVSDDGGLLLLDVIFEFGEKEEEKKKEKKSGKGEMFFNLFSFSSPSL